MSLIITSKTTRTYLRSTDGFELNEIAGDVQYQKPLARVEGQGLGLGSGIRVKGQGQRLGLRVKGQGLGVRIRDSELELGLGLGIRVRVRSELKWCSQRKMSKWPSQKAIAHVLALSMSCLYLALLSCLCLLCLAYTLSMSCLRLVYILSMSCLWLVYVSSISCLCIVYILSVFDIESTCAFFGVSSPCTSLQSPESTVASRVGLELGRVRVRVRIKVLLWGQGWG